MAQSTLTYTQDEVAKGLQDFIITIEMVFFAIAHRKFFSYKVRKGNLFFSSPPPDTTRLR